MPDDEPSETDCVLPSAARPAATEPPRLPVDPNGLCLPRCARPKPGDRVVWYRAALRSSGVLLGHDWRGRPVVKADDQETTDVLPARSSLRWEDPDRVVGPSWTGPGAPYLTARPRATEAAGFRRLLRRGAWPGPAHEQLVAEVYARGYEIYLVGSAVRDVLCGRDPHDVELATSMPLDQLFGLLEPMYQLPPNRLKDYHRQWGHLRVGGDDRPDDSVLDVLALRAAYVGTANAVFSSGFARDVAYRDFTCNSLYVDPVNQVIHDPTGLGLRDCDERRLRLTFDETVAHPGLKAEIVFRAARFRCGGFTLDPAAVPLLAEWARQTVPSMLDAERDACIRQHLLGQGADTDHDQVFDLVRDFFVLDLDAADEWVRYVEPLRGGTL